MLSGTTRTNASAASFSELTSDGPSRPDTGTWYWSDSPMSPRKKWPTQLAYCVRIGRSRPNLWLKRSTECWSAKPPRTLRPTSPGRSCAVAKTITLRKNSVTTERTRRLARKRVTRQSCSARPSSRGSAAGRSCRRFRSGERRVAEEDRPLRVGLVAPDVPPAGREVVVEVREDHGRVVEQDPLHLPGELPLVLERDRADVRPRRAVEPPARVVRRVPDALRLERGGQEDVRHGAVAPVGDVHRRVQPRRRAPAGR